MSQLLGRRGSVTQRRSVLTNNTNGFPEKSTAHNSSVICDCMQSLLDNQRTKEAREVCIINECILKLCIEDC